METLSLLLNVGPNNNYLDDDGFKGTRCLGSVELVFEKRL